SELPADYDLYLMTATGGVLGQSVHEGTAPESLEFVALPGDYFIVVQADPEREIDSGRAYSLVVQAENVAAASTPPPPAAPVDPRPVLAQDNFDDPTRGFLPRFTAGPDLTYDYVEGEYSVRNLGPAT